jgi:hypothetical protein
MRSQERSFAWPEAAWFTVQFAGGQPLSSTLALMKTHSEMRQAVEQGIRKAFSGVTLGSGISLRQAAVIDNYREGVTDEQFSLLPLSEETKKWDHVTFEELESDNIAHLDPEGFRFYLPAFMISVLDAYDACSMRVIGTLSALYPKDHLAEYHMSRYDCLSYEQKQAVACFLEALPKLVQLIDEDRKIVERAMGYWTTYLPIFRAARGALKR